MNPHCWYCGAFLMYEYTTYFCKNHEKYEVEYNFSYNYNVTTIAFRFKQLSLFGVNRLIRTDINGSSYSYINSTNFLFLQPYFLLKYSEDEFEDKINLMKVFS